MSNSSQIISPSAHIPNKGLQCQLGFLNQKGCAFNMHKKIMDVRTCALKQISRTTPAKIGFRSTFLETHPFLQGLNLTKTDLPHWPNTDSHNFLDRTCRKTIPNTSPAVLKHNNFSFLAELQETTQREKTSSETEGGGRSRWSSPKGR